jgi:hypothetical protein
MSLQTGDIISSIFIRIRIYQVAIGLPAVMRFLAPILYLNSPAI